MPAKKSKNSGKKKPAKKNETLKQIKEAYVDSLVENIKAGKTTLDEVRRDLSHKGVIHSIAEYKDMKKSARSKAVAGTSDVKGLDDGSSTKILDAVEEKLAKLHNMSKRAATEVYMKDVIDNIGKTKKSSLFADIQRPRKSAGAVPLSTYADLLPEDRMRIRRSADIEGMDDGSNEAKGRIVKIESRMKKKPTTDRKEARKKLNKPTHERTDAPLSFRGYIKLIEESNPGYSYAQYQYAAKSGGGGWYEEYKSDVKSNSESDSESDSEADSESKSS